MELMIQNKLKFVCEPTTKKFHRDFLVEYLNNHLFHYIVEWTNDILKPKR